MKFSTFYFSGTGNTRWAVETFNAIISEKDHQAAMFSIDFGENLTDEHILKIVQAADCIGLANPIYGGDIPPIMKEFIDRLIKILKPVQTEKKVFVINTFGYVNAFGPNEMKKLLAGSGLVLTAYVNIQLCNNVVTTKPVDRELLNKRMARGKTELTRLADRLLSGRKRIKGHGPQLMIGAMIRKKVPEAIARHHQTLGVNMETCTRCMACVNNCPTGSILFDEGEGFTFLPGCTASMRCYNFCPTGSITMNGIYADPNQVPRYHGPV
ncbi:EFR1 family ferrodoxin [Acetobacterium sp.]|uniref:EFR1 family ferrodoxin n=1 Tax=Acetobacterium sp. TaxID=1872094 RepID=UPI002F41A213